METNNFFISARKIRKYTYEISFRFNLKLIFISLLIIAALAAIGGLIYGLFLGVSALAGLAWDGIVWLAAQWVWLLIVLGLVLLFLLGRYLLKKGKITPKQMQKVGISLLAIILLVLLAMLLGKGCSSCSRQEQPSEEITISKAEEFKKEFNKAFDWVVISRAYLDGVQGQGEKRALVGLKYVDGRPVSEMEFSGKAYEEAKEIIAKDWRVLVEKELNGVKLSKRQLVTVILFAMRNGKYGFQKSDFLAAIKAGDLIGAEKKMHLHKADGSKRTLGTEAQQYLWVLKNLWIGSIEPQEFLDMPILSYKSLSLREMYEQGMYQNDIRTQGVKKIHTGNGKTPRQALGL